MTEVQSHITRLPIENGILPFLVERYRELGIAADPMELFNEAAHLRVRIEKHQSYAKNGGAYWRNLVARRNRRLGQRNRIC